MAGAPLETSPQPAAPASRTASRSMITLAVLFGQFISVMDVSVVNVALPHMQGAFGADISSITWVATSYSIAQLIMICMTSWWSTLLGRKRFYLLSYVLFSLGSILAGTSTSFGEMIFYRAIQGLGGGPLIPISQAILRESYPPRLQGMAMAIFGMGVVLAPAMGPVVGGWLTERYGWPWIFYINIPFCLAGMLLVHLYVQDPSYLKRGIKGVDWGGILFLLVSMIGLQIILERGQENNWFESSFIVGWTAATAAAGVLLVVWELKAAEPIVNFRLLRHLQLSVGSAIILLFALALFGSTFILPQFLQALLRYTAYDSGIVLLPRGIALFLMMPLVGRLFNVVDPRLTMTFGMSCILYSFYGLSQLSLDAGFWNMVQPLIVMGIGMPCVFVTNTTIAIRGVLPAETTAAASLYDLGRVIGGNMGFALLATLVERRSATHRVGLVGYVNEFNGAFVEYHGSLMDILAGQRMDPATAHTKAYAIVDHVVNQQAAMLAYNDTFWFMMIILGGILPLVWVLPGKPKTP
ncbi:MAG: DHA2 family efflux MFS transporter permease subunit [Candidatus Tectomicrobia bacterium]|uniref:DHA2 family efflux MFS transporter permease subunit n=1 Tax=Tectimicrobiota bacterium TaxID=2528274 RepID=A0A932MMD8_UNCTE|nr:DHA2 family efflux MFS transporter permease subunit [Candidatus Tectomicrobia bacterium]